MTALEAAAQSRLDTSVASEQELAYPQNGLVQQHKATDRP